VRPEGYLWRRHLRTYSKLLKALAASPTIFQDREDMRPEGVRATGCTNARRSLEVREVFMAGPDDEQVEAPSSYGGPLRITEGAVTQNGGP
jgi:hypothetical protein